MTARGRRLDTLREGALGSLPRGVRTLRGQFSCPLDY